MKNDDKPRRPSWRTSVRTARAIAEAERWAADLRATPDDDLAAECARRGWVVTRG